MIAQKTLRDFWRKHPDAESPLRAWDHEAKNARWQKPDDIKKRHRSVDSVAGNRVIFNMGGNRYRLVVAIRYQARLVYIRFIGTHAQYDRIDVEKV